MFHINKVRLLTQMQKWNGHTGLSMTICYIGINCFMTIHKYDDEFIGLEDYINYLQNQILCLEFKLSILIIHISSLSSPSIILLLIVLNQIMGYFYVTLALC